MDVKEQLFFAARSPVGKNVYKAGVYMYVGVYKTQMQRYTVYRNYELHVFKVQRIKIYS